MTFILTIELPAGSTYAEIQRRAELAVSRLPSSECCKPDAPERHGLCISDVRGEWRLER